MISEIRGVKSVLACDKNFMSKIILNMKGGRYNVTAQ